MINKNNSNVNDRVKKYREKIKAKGLKKVEVYIKPENEKRLRQYVKRYCQ